MRTSAFIYFLLGITFVSVSIDFAPMDSVPVVFAQDNRGGFFSENYDVKGGMFDRPRTQPQQAPSTPIPATPAAVHQRDTNATNAGAQLDPATAMERLRRQTRGSSGPGGIPWDRYKRITDAAKKASGMQHHVVPNTSTTTNRNGATTTSARSSSTKTREREAVARPATVSVFVAEWPTSHVARALKDLLYLRRLKKINIAEVVVVGTRQGADSPLIDKGVKEAYQDLTRYGPMPLGYKSRLPEELGNVESSPLWVINHSGKNYLFEGSFDLLQYFSRDGIFDPNTKSFN